LRKCALTWQNFTTSLEKKKSNEQEKKYTAEFKAKVALDFLPENLTLGQIYTRYSVMNKSVSV